MLFVSVTQRWGHCCLFFCLLSLLLFPWLLSLIISSCHPTFKPHHFPLCYHSSKPHLLPFLPFIHSLYLTYIFEYIVPQFLSHISISYNDIFPTYSFHFSPIFSNPLPSALAYCCLSRAHNWWWECTTSGFAPYPAGGSIDTCGRAPSPWWYPPEIHEGVAILTASQWEKMRERDRRREKTRGAQQKQRLYTDTRMYVYVHVCIYLFCVHTKWGNLW